MKITDIHTHLIHPSRGKNWLFVKVETDEGIHGWGECYTQADRDRTIEIHVQELANYLEGRSPFEIKHFNHWAYHDYGGKRGAMELYCAMSGIEHALWDICGKASGQPIYNMLGGKCRERIRVYANGWGGGSTPDEIANRARQVVDLGFTALKFDPFPGRWRTIIDRSVEVEAVERVRAVREAVGPDVEILVEVHRRLSPLHAIRVAREMEPFRPYWYEEPVSVRDPNGLQEAKRGVNIPVVTGEELYTKAEFRDIFEKRATDIINPDVCNCGGILELKEIAAMAEVYHVAVSPHNYNSTTIGLAATIHASATMPNFLITEYFLNFEEIGQEIARPAFEVEDSHIRLPTSPGLGIDLDESALANRPYQHFKSRNLPHPADER
ncbi:MAG: mandelate racemase [Gemmatimonadetes bacterium]|nr:mandelate racemase [Gemmatimonadota bacterium]